MKAFITRHGYTPYKQGKVSLEDACDITEDAKITLKNSARNMCELAPTHNIEILSSPYGRALASAKVIYSELKSMGAYPKDIVTIDQLEEVKNFNWNIFIGLVDGTPISLDGSEYHVDCSKTNPDKLSPVEFFRGDYAQNDACLSCLPKPLYEQVSKFEKCADAEARLESVLNSIGHVSVIVTHEGLTGSYFTKLTKDSKSYLDRGNFIMLEKEGIWVPKYTNQK